MILQDQVGLLETFSRLAKVCLQQNNFALISNLFHRYLLEPDIDLQVELSIRFVKALSLYDSTNKQLTSYVYQTIDLLEQEDKDVELLEFIADLEKIDEPMHDKAQQYLKNNL